MTRFCVALVMVYLCLATGADASYQRRRRTVHKHIAVASSVDESGVTTKTKTVTTVTSPRKAG